MMVDYQTLRGGREAVVLADMDNTLLFDGAIEPATINAISSLLPYALFGIMTGKRLSSYMQMPIAQAEILGLENGCLIYAGVERDKEWDSYIEAGMEPVIKLKKTLGSKYTIDHEKGKGFTIQCSPVAEHEVKSYEKDGVRLRFNRYLGKADFFPDRGGKDSAARYLSEKLGISLDNFHALGDDDNDFDMLSVVGNPCTFASSSEGLIRLAKKGFITTHQSHEGTQEILRHILAKITA